MKKFFENIPFEFILLGCIVPAAVLTVKFSYIYALLLLLLCIIFAWLVNLYKGIFAGIGVILLALCAFLHRIPEENTLKKELDSRPLYGKIRFEIIDPLCCSLPEIRNGAVVQVKIHSIISPAHEKYSGKGSFLIFSKEVIPEDCRYGDIFETWGTLRFADAQNVWNIDGDIPDFNFRFGDFQRYMQLRKIDGIISVDSNEKTLKVGERDSFFRQMLYLRDMTLEYAVSNIRNRDNKNLLAALFFGLKGALESETKQHYIKSGTIHLFSVSGLHIGILFAILLPLLSFVPVRWRYLSASALLIPFLLSTGANVPAIRAFLMILGFSVLRCFCFTVPPLRILALGCCIFLIWNPDYLLDAGFLYSFGITAVLLMSGESIGRWSSTWNTDNSLRAVNRKNPRKYSGIQVWCKRAVFAFFSIVAAFACGSLITLAAFGYLYLSAVWVNFFILFYCTLLIYLFLLKMIINPVFCIGMYAGKFMDGCLDFMQRVIEFGAEYPLELNSIQISWFWALLFYAALIVLLRFRNRTAFIFSLIFVLIFFPVGMLAGRLQKSELLVIREPSGADIAFVLSEPSANYAWCFNINDTVSAELARKFLASRGISNVNLWIQRGSAQNRNQALINSLKNMKIGRVMHISRTVFPAEGDFFSKVIYERKAENINNWEFKTGMNVFFCKKNQIGFEYFNPRVILPLSVVFDRETQMLVFESAGGREIRKIKNSNLLEYFVYEL